MDMYNSVMLFVFGLLMLIKGGDWFVDGATAIARKFHLPELLIGATVVSIGTTLPEVMVSDNLTAKENLTVIAQILTASGRQYVLKGNYNAFTPAHVGEYRIVMSVMDEFGNIESMAYVVTVTE